MPLFSGKKISIEWHLWFLWFLNLPQFLEVHFNLKKPNIYERNISLYLSYYVLTTNNSFLYLWFVRFLFTKVFIQKVYQIAIASFYVVCLLIYSCKVHVASLGTFLPPGKGMVFLSPGHFLKLFITLSTSDYVAQRDKNEPNFLSSYLFLLC